MNYQIKMKQVATSTEHQKILIKAFNIIRVNCNIGKDVEAVQVQHMIEFLNDHFGNCTIQDLITGSGLYAAGDLDIPTVKEWDLTPTLLGKLLKANARYKAKNAAIDVNKALPQGNYGKYSRPIEVIRKEAWEVLHDYFINEVKADPYTYGYCWVEAFDYGAENRLLGLDRDTWDMFKDNCRAEWEHVSQKSKLQDEDGAVVIAIERLNEPKSFISGCKVAYMKQYVRQRLSLLEQDETVKS